MVARVVRNGGRGRTSAAFEALRSHEERDHRSWALLTGAEAGRLQRLTLSCVRQAWLNVNSLDKVRWKNKLEIKGDQALGMKE